MNCVSSNDLSLKYKRFTPLGWQDLSIKKFEFVTKTQFLSPLVFNPIPQKIISPPPLSHRPRKWGELYTSYVHCTLYIIPSLYDNVYTLLTLYKHVYEKQRADEPDQ